MKHFHEAAADFAIKEIEKENLAKEKETQYSRQAFPDFLALQAFFEYKLHDEGQFSAESHVDDEEIQGLDLRLYNRDLMEIQVKPVVSEIFNSVSNDWAVEKHKFARELLSKLVDQYTEEGKDLNTPDEKQQQGSFILSPFFSLCSLSLALISEIIAKVCDACSEEGYTRIINSIRGSDRLEVLNKNKC